MSSSTNFSIPRLASAPLPRVRDICALERVSACLSVGTDGPPFRVDILLKYAEWLIKPEQNNGSWVADVLWPVINLDLQWISSHWNQSS
jgi:hypothetical protein